MNKTRKFLSVLLTLCMVITLMPVTAWAGYATISVSTADELTAALATMQDYYTIELNADIEYGVPITVDGKDITFDLNGYTLDVTVASGIAMNVVGGGSVSLSGAGELNVTSNIGIGLETSDIDSSATVTNATGKGEGSFGASASDGANITIEENVVAIGEDSTGAFCGGMGGSIRVKGNVESTGEGCVGVGLSCGATTNTVIVDGDVTATGNGSFGISNSCGDITIGGSVTATGANSIGADNQHGNLIVNGDIAAPESGSTGVNCEGLTVTVKGKITAPIYASVDGVLKTKDDGIGGSGSNEGYNVFRTTDSYGYVTTLLVGLPITVGTNGSYSTLNAAIAAANDGDVIKLLNDLTESVTCTVEEDRIITIDGNNKKITGSITPAVAGDEGNPEYSVALSLNGMGSIRLKNLTLQGGDVTGSESSSIGMAVPGDVTVHGAEMVSVIGGIASDSCGLMAMGMGTVSLTTATGIDIGVSNEGFAMTNVNAATGTGSDSTGVYNSDLGEVDVTTAIGGKYGVQNDSDSSGTIDVITATATGAQGTGVSNAHTGTVNVTTATGNQNSIFNNSGTTNMGTVNAKTANGPISNSGTMNVSAANGSILNSGTMNVGVLTGTSSGEGTINTGTSTASITLNKGTGANCVLDSITVAANGNTTVGILPSVFKNGVVGDWFAESAKTTALYWETTVTAAITLYSSFYTASTSSGGSGGGGGGGVTTVPPSETPGATTATTGTTTIATTITTAVIGPNGSAAASITADQLTDAFDKAIAGAKGTDGKALVEIKVEGTAKSTSVSTAIPQAAFKDLSNSSADGLKISTPLGTVTFDDAAMSEINDKATGDIKITVAQADTSKLTEAEKAAVGGRPVYDLTVDSGNTIISSFGGGSATVSVPYTLAAGEDTTKIVIYYLSDKGNLVMMPNCSYDAKTGMVTFITNHFSNYVVGYNNVSFSDVSGWYAENVNFLAARGILNGSNGKFNPSSDITRAEFVTILANLSGADLSTYTGSSFTDVDEAQWFSGAVQWAYENGIATGTNGKFNPNANMTRQDMAVMIARYAEKTANYTLPETKEAILFTDSTEIASYASDAVASMQQADIISGNADGSFAPADNANRAQAAKMIALLLQGMI